MDISSQGQGGIGPLRMQALFDGRDQRWAKQRPWDSTNDDIGDENVESI
ncbi:hypothetical protein [Halotalea alkalilenta]|nr:hypothetical protein [Halotalea alkalilenta]